MPDQNGTVTMREFYESQLQIQKELVEMRKEQCLKIDEMQKEILVTLKDLPALIRQVEINAEEINKLRSSSNLKDALLGVLTVIGSVLGISLKGP